MRLPDISPRHRLLVRTVSTIGTGALSTVRRRDFAPAHQGAARAAYAVATAALTWLSGTRAFAEQNIDDHLFDPDGEAGEPMRYVEAGDADDFGFVAGEEVRESTWTSQEFLNAAAALAAGAASWALWGPVQNLKDRVDAKLPDGVGRGLGAALNSSLVAATAFAVDKAEEFLARESLEGNIFFAPVEITLPDHIRASVDTLLDQPHPQSQDIAEAVRTQLEHARFFVTVTYPQQQFPGDDPIELSDEELTALLAEEDVANIEIHLDADAPRVIPADQTYPVIGVLDDRRGSAPLELSLEIHDGRLTDIVLLSNGDDAGERLRVEASLENSSPGTLHPAGVDPGPDEVEDVEDDEEPPRTLATWPAPAELNFRTDGS